MKQADSRSRKFVAKLAYSVLGASLLPTLSALSGCGSAYSGVVGSSGLGAGQYIPAVYVEPGNEATYQSVLQICRQVANNRQMTTAQESQLKTLTGAVEGTVGGAATGLEFANMLSAFEGSPGISVDRGEGALIGAGIGLATSLASSFASGSENSGGDQESTITVPASGFQRWQTLAGSGVGIEVILSEICALALSTDRARANNKSEQTNNEKFHSDNHNSHVGWMRRYIEEHFLPKFFYAGRFFLSKNNQT